jgi:hypothetical protein
VVNDLVACSYCPEIFLEEVRDYNNLFRIYVSVTNFVKFKNWIFKERSSRGATLLNTVLCITAIT